jgi:hypothetical protein
MKISIVEKPVKHIHIEGFLNKEELSKCMGEMQDIQQFFYEGEWYTNERGRHVNHEIKKCVNCDPYIAFNGRENESYILTHVFSKLWTPELRETYDKCGEDSVFSFLNDTDVDHALIAGFRNGDFYDWHRDLGMVTTNIFIADPEANTPEGGTFHLSNVARTGDNEKLFGEKYEETSYEFKPGDVVIFPARFRHKVDPVKTKTDNFRDMRFSLQNRCIFRG